MKPLGSSWRPVGLSHAWAPAEVHHTTCVPQSHNVTPQSHKVTRRSTTVTTSLVCSLSTAATRRVCRCSTTAAASTAGYSWRSTATASVAACYSLSTAAYATSVLLLLVQLHTTVSVLLLQVQLHAVIAQPHYCSSNTIFSTTAVAVPQPSIGNTDAAIRSRTLLKHITL